MVNTGTKKSKWHGSAMQARLPFLTSCFCIKHTDLFTDQMCPSEVLDVTLPIIAVERVSVDYAVTST